MNTNKFILLSLMLAVFMSVGALALPFGANYTEEASTRAPADPAANHSALAGNVTEITLTGFSTTQTWQGYFGNVSGTVQLADSSDNVMYNWSLASPEGEVYATNGSVDWSQVQCLNFSASGTFASDAAQIGGTSLHGLNITQLEAMYNIAFDDVDGVDETFSLTGDHESGGNLAHDLFYTNSLQFDAGQCLSTHLFQLDGAVNGTVTDGEFQQVLLYEPTNRAVIFTALLDEEDNTGFDGKNHDFQMLVLEDGHGTDTATTTYFFYVELE